jgi:transposase InsO family protein
MAKKLKTNTVAPNIVNRRFKAFAPRQVLLTDITYLPFQGSFCYLSTVLDACTHEILASMVSSNLKVDFVIDTVDMLIATHGMQLDNEIIIHSDQGCHYTSMAFINKLRDHQFVQSMSRKGNCWDNAPQESFFGHMKDEIKNLLMNAKTFDEIKSIIENWIDYYNNDRYQWDLQKLSPREYYEYKLTGNYPLAVGHSKSALRGSAPDPAV